MEEHSTFVIEERRQHSRLDRSASEIPDVPRFLLDDFGFQSRRNVCLHVVLFGRWCVQTISPFSYPELEWLWAGPWML